MSRNSFTNQPQLVPVWHRRLCILHNAHTRCATLFDRRNLTLGVPVVGLTTIVGTSIFATLASTSQDVRIKILIALLSLAAAVLASLQTLLRYSEQSQKHKAVAVQYGILRREMEELLMVPEASIEPDVLRSIRARWDTIEESSPSIPQRIYDLAKTEYGPKLIAYEK